MQRNTPELLSLQHRHREHLTSCSFTYFLCARKLQIRRLFKSDTASGRSEFKGKRLIIPVHCKRLQGIALCCWGTWLRDSGVFTQKEEAQCRYTTLRNWMLAHYLLYLTVGFWRKLQRKHSGREKTSWLCTQGLRNMTLIETSGKFQLSVGRSLVPLEQTDPIACKSLLSDLPDCFLEQWLRLTCGHLACNFTGVRLPSVTSGVWHVCLFWCFTHELQGQRRG